MWGEQGRRAEARDLRAPVYGWFTEGFDTADLKKTKTMLEELTSTGDYPLTYRVSQYVPNRSNGFSPFGVELSAERVQLLRRANRIAQKIVRWLIGPAEERRARYRGLSQPRHQEPVLALSR